MRSVTRPARWLWAGSIISVALIASSCTGGGSDKDQDQGKAPTATSPVTVSMFAPTDENAPDIRTNDYTKYVQKKYHMKIDWDLVPSSDAETKQSLQISSGSYPDVFMSAHFSPSQVIQYANQGVFVPLNDLIKKYAPNLWNAMQKYPELKQMNTAPDGMIYSLAKYNYCFHCKYPDKMWVNARYLKEFNLKIPTTTDEFTHMLEVFKAHGLSLGGSTDNSVIPFLMNAFTYSAGYSNANLFTVDNDGKLIFTANTGKWRAGLNYIHDLYAKGLLAKSVFTDSSDDLARGISQHKIGVFPTLCPNCTITNFGGPGTDAKYWVSIPPLAGPDGTRLTSYAPSSDEVAFVMTNKASKAAQIAVMKMINEMYTTWGALREDYGPTPNKLWQPAKKGQLGLTGEQALFDINWSAVFGSGGEAPNVGWGGLGPNFQSKEWFNGYVAPAPLSGSNEERTLQLMTDMFYAGIAPEKVMTNAFWVKPEDAQQYSSDAGNLWTYIQQWTANFVVGAKSLDSDWGSYVKGLNGLGLNRYVATSQAAMKAPLSTTSDGPNDAASRHSLAMMPASQAWEVALLKDAYQRERGTSLGQ